MKGKIFMRHETEPVNVKISAFSNRNATSQLYLLIKLIKFKKLIEFGTVSAHELFNKVLKKRITIQVWLKCLVFNVVLGVMLIYDNLTRH